MKRFIIIISALLLVLSLSQCKKKPIVTDNALQPVSITLDVNGGSKVNVNPATGDVAFESGDVIYVAYKGKYVGTITHNGSCFSGSISATPDGVTPLYFYFLGNKAPYETLTEGSSTSVSVDIIDQTTTLPVISAAASDQPFNGSGNYTAKLANKCALVKFNVTTASNDAATCIKGLNNKISITFDSENIGTINYERVSDASICLAAGNGEKWAILLPQTGVGTGSDCLAYSHDLAYTGTYATIGNVDENGFIQDDVIVNVKDEYQAKISKAFSVSTTKSVYFSRGNLQYIGSAAIPYWRFAINQFDYLGVNGQGSADINVDRDLFGWGCTGYQDSEYNSMQTYYYPYTVSNDKPGRYGPTYDQTDKPDLSVSRNSDWGCVAIVNGVGSSWRTLSSTEWSYLLNERQITKRFVKAEVNYINGLVLLPDGWDEAVSIDIPHANDINVKYKTTRITKELWETIYDPNGAVFLPAVGYRSGVDLYQVQADGYYWTNNCGTEYSAVCMYFTGATMGNNSGSRYGGYAVRLVCDAE